MRDLRAQSIIEISISDNTPLRHTETQERVDKVFVIAPSHEDAQKRVKDAYESREGCYRAECNDDNKPTKIYFIVASNEYQARFIAIQLYRQVPQVWIADAKPFIPKAVQADG